MKKSISFTIIISLALLLFSSCSTPKKDNNNDIDNDNDINIEKENFAAKDNDFLYELDGNIIFTVSDTGNIYYVNLDEVEKSIVILDLNGEEIGTAEIEVYGMINGTVVIDNVFYFSYSPVNSPGTTEIFSYSFDTEKQEKITVFEGFTEVSKIVSSGSKLYLLGKNNELMSNTGYVGGHDYGGECIKSVDLKSLKIETEFEPDKIPVMIAGTEEGGVIIYAYDEQDGYYFRELNSDKKIINDKLSNLFQMNDYANFEMYGESRVIYISGQLMYLSPIDGSSEAKELLGDLSASPLQNRFFSKSGYFFISVKNGIRRVYGKELLTGSTVLNIAYTNPYSLDFPSPAFQKLGFSLDFKIAPYYDFTLSLLSHDSQYDLYYLYSSHDISDNIRRKGAFYPLNVVPFVKEYIDACFPYVKEAAYDDNGDIWMIPINLYTDAVIYNELLCAEYGIDTASIKTLEELAKVLQGLRSMDLKVQFSVSHVTFFERYFYQIMRKNNGFNRDDFQKMAINFYENINFIKTDWTYQQYPGKGLNFEDLLIGGDSPHSDELDHRGKYFISNYGVPDDKQIIKSTLDAEDFDEEGFWKRINENQHFAGNSLNYLHNRLMMFPPIEGMTESDVIMELIAVNPNSKNLEVVLDYISKLCEYQMNLKNSFILKDKSTYSDRQFISDIYDILNYEGNFIRFSLDSELIYGDFEKYLGDEITLDEYLNRTEFKINAYLDE